MRVTFDECYYFLIWRTYRALPLLDDKHRRMLLGFWKKQSVKLRYRLIGWAFGVDHVHMYVQASPVWSPAKLVNYIKGSAAHWVNSVQGGGFGWQKGYSVQTVSKKNTPDVMRYLINHQERYDKKYPGRKQPA